MIDFLPFDVNQSQDVQEKMAGVSPCILTLLYGVLSGCFRTPVEEMLKQQMFENKYTESWKKTGVSPCL